MPDPMLAQAELRGNLQKYTGVSYLPPRLTDTPVMGMVTR